MHPKIVLERLCQVARPVVADQSRAILDRHVLYLRPLDGLLNHFADRFRRHVRLQLPRQDRARVIVKHRDQAIAAPTHHESNLHPTAIAHSPAWS